MAAGRKSWIVRLVTAVVLAGTLAGAFGLGAWLMLRVAVKRSPEITVPDLVGADTESASSRLRDAGLSPEIAGRRHDPSQPEGKVLSQIPAAGSNTRPGRPVRLVVSLGAKRAVVPDLAGSSQARAQLTLRGAGFELGGVTEAPDRRAPAGRVIGQHPPPGTDGRPGDEISLLVSAGPGPRTYVMPDLTGWPVVRAATVLERAGFRRVRAAGVPGGAVSAQEPRAGFPVRADDAVTLTAGGGKT